MRPRAVVSSAVAVKGAAGQRTVASGRHGGFVLAFVVLMLFSISVAGAAGYLVVMSEFGLAKHSSDGAEALTVARAGLERFIAESIGVVGDSVSYALGDGVALVTTRRLVQQDSVTDLYYVRSEGTVADRFSPNTPARRVVGGYAIHRRRPLPHHAAVISAANQVRAQSGGQAHGIDYNTAFDCPGGGASDIIGAVALGTVTEQFPSDVQGSPESAIWPGGTPAILDSIALRWDVLTDPDFPIYYDGFWPDFSTLPADSFPIIRYAGFMYTNVVGRGVLIAPGTFDPGPSFSWDGIVLAGSLDDYIQGELRGLLVGGLGGPSAYPTVYVYTDIRYHSCNVYAANETLSYLELVDNTVFEAR